MSGWQRLSGDIGCPAAGQLRARLPNTGEPNTGEPNTGEPNTGEPNTGEPNTGEPNTGEPNTGEPNTGEPNAASQHRGNTERTPLLSGAASALCTRSTGEPPSLTG